jgi:hypothetical protein
MTAARLRLRSWLAIIAAFAAASVGFACPAGADPVGRYVVTWDDGTAPTQWTFTPCGPGCSRVTGASWSAGAHLINGRWVMAPVQHTSRCADGSPENDTANGSFDAVTLAGTSYVNSPTPCSEHPGTNGWTIHFQLTPAS